MTTTRLAGKLPDEPDVNSLDHSTWLKHFRREPHVPVVAIVTLGVQKLVTDYEKSTVTPILQVESVEVLGAIGDTPEAVLDALAAARDRRLHQDPLPVQEQPNPDPECWDCHHPESDHTAYRDDARQGCTWSIEDEDSGETLPCACHGFRAVGEALQLTDGIDIEAAVRQAEQLLDDDAIVVEGQVIDPETGEVLGDA